MNHEEHEQHREEIRRLARDAEWKRGVESDTIVWIVVGLVLLAIVAISLTMVALRTWLPYIFSSPS